MPDGARQIGISRIKPGDPGLAARLRREIEGEVLFDRFDRGRYSTDASIYQIEPVGVIRPRSIADVEAAISIAREEGVPVLARGGGTSQAGQTVGEALVIDTSRYLNAVLDLDLEGRRITVEPGAILGQINKTLARHGLFFPVDISTASRATIGGMAANNSCGSRSIRYGNMVHNVLSLKAILADGTTHAFGPVPGNLGDADFDPRTLDLAQRMRALAAREADEIARRVPKVLRHVAGYNLHTVDPAGHNLAHLLVGSEGTLGFFTEIELPLQPLPAHRVLGVCHFPRFHDAMAATQHIVGLGPDAVELVDRTIIELSGRMGQFRATVQRAVRGEPDALLLVEFAGDEFDHVRRKLDDLTALMGDLGFPDSVVRAEEAEFQRAIWSVREAGLNIVMSMKGTGKPVSFIEDCAVPLEHLAEFTDRLTAVFDKHGTRGTWYAHASVGLLHVRPILNLKEEDGARKMRAIAEEAFAMVREYKGSHSGEHGDGLIRSEFHEVMLGGRLVRAFEEVKDTFDPGNLFNPGKIVRVPRMDDRSLFRYRPEYSPLPIETALDWSAWGGFAGAAEMCNNNGTCRKMEPGVMCPSFRATQDEQHLTRGRANTLRLALTGQLGPEALTSDEMFETMDLCVGCKGCRRECPTGVDMARMKIEFLHHYKSRHGWSLKDRLIGYLPRYAGRAARLAPLLNLRDSLPGVAALAERFTGFSANRSMPRWRNRPFRPPPGGELVGDGRDVVLLADTFNAAFEPENLVAAMRVLGAGGYHVHTPTAPGARRPLCCGRTFLSVGMVDEARTEARRTLSALKSYVEAGVPVIGLEPACLLSLRDEFHALIPGPETEALSEQTFLMEEFIAAESDRGRLSLPLNRLPASRAMVHGHCHQKSFGAVDSILTTLRLVPGLEPKPIEAGCCGMAGAFGYEASHYDVSMKMAEAALLPAVRAESEGSLIVADGTSCRHQIRDGAAVEALHTVRVLESALSV